MDEDEDFRKLRQIITVIVVITFVAIAVQLVTTFINGTILQLTKKVEFLEKELRASKEKELKLLEEETKLLEMRNECTKMGHFNK